MPDQHPDTPPPHNVVLTGLVRIVMRAVVGGAATGLVGGAFRRLLVGANGLRGELLRWATAGSPLRVVVPMVLGAVFVATARFLVRRVPEAADSGVQRVEAHIRGEVAAAPTRVVPVKFVGGVLVLGSGMVLGRVGPTEQMGATIGAELSRWARLSPHESRTLTVSLAGAGLGVAFNAPLGGAVFVFEEVARAFRTRLVVATLVGTASALLVSRWVTGGAPVLPVGEVDAGPAWVLTVYVVLGLLLGALGVAYNRVVVLFLHAAAWVRGVAPEAKAAAVAVVVVGVGLAAPWLVGGGDALNETILVGSPAAGALVVILLVRWVLGPLSYSVATPGGRFAPLLVLGATSGSLLAIALDAVLPGSAAPTTAFAVVGMSSFFAGVVRAPVTGVVLIAGMTAQTTLVLPMVVGAAAAAVTASLLHGPPGLRQPPSADGEGGELSGVVSRCLGQPADRMPGCRQAITALWRSGTPGSPGRPTAGQAGWWCASVGS